MFRRIVGFNSALERNYSSEEVTIERAAAMSRARHLFALHPAELLSLLETGWQTRVHTQADLGHPDHRSDIPGLPGINNISNANIALDIFGPNILQNREIFSATRGDGLVGQSRWDHLIYAWAIEATGIYEIFRRILHEFAHGESLGTPSAETTIWLRSTELLFYNFNRLPLFFIGSLSSEIKPDFKATLYNAFYRMFGTDSAYKSKQSKPYEFVKAGAINSTFIQSFEYFLHEVWQAISNRNNTSGVNLTDNSGLSIRADSLYDMCRARREGGNLARIEYLGVSLMSWFHMTVEFNSNIVVDLRCEASSPQDRLSKLAARVGMKSNNYSKNYFDMAENCSRILTMIETGLFNDETSVPALYQEGSPIEADIKRIITNWSEITKRDIKRQMPVGI